MLPSDTKEARRIQQYHAHQVCGIVAHTKDRGVASVSIRSMAIVSEVLTDQDEREEVVSIMENIDRETGWKLVNVIRMMKRTWGWERATGPMPLAGVAQIMSGGCMPEDSSTLTMLPGMAKAQAHGPSLAPIAMSAPRPIRNVNPLSFGDFSLPNHPYRDWYEPPSRSNKSQSPGF
jgi:hypothetical protein